MLRQERLSFSKRDIARPIGIFVVTLVVYGMLILAALASPLWASVVLVPVSGVLVSMLFVIGHDACHQSLTSSGLLNHVIGRIAFLPSLHAFSLWGRQHNQRHHRFNNIRYLDCYWVPMSPDEFAKASPARRWLYQLYRHPIGAGFYYLFEIWPQQMIIARRAVLGEVRPVHVADSLLVWAFLAADVAALATVGSWFDKSAAISITIGLLLSFVIFTAFLSVATLLHHTHPAVPWYSTLKDWQDDDGTISGTAHVEMPWYIQNTFLFIMEHTAHHYAPGVPFYNLDGMQRRMNEQGVLSYRITLKQFLAVCQACKLFNYEERHWLNFHGKRTSNVLRTKPINLA